MSSKRAAQWKAVDADHHDMTAWTTSVPSMMVLIAATTSRELRQNRAMIGVILRTGTGRSDLSHSARECMTESAPRSAETRPNQLTVREPSRFHSGGSHRPHHCSHADWLRAFCIATGMELLRSMRCGKPVIFGHGGMRATETSGGVYSQQHLFAGRHHIHGIRGFVGAIGQKQNNDGSRGDAALCPI
jgi:hypothetical protein